ncbi:MAG: HDOD domain-containing protein [Desulfobacterales bacterium]|nr:HDOD domain-containing protein [Desulfobacterales bacterium]
MAKKTLFDKIKQSRHLPQLPQVMLKLIRACNDGNSSTRELTDIISTDPALTSKLLQIMGSSYVNLPREVNSVKAAVVYLGLDTIRNIAISSSAMHFFSIAKKIPEFNINAFWFHSYKTAVLARRIAQESGEAEPDEFFLAGLLHNIGRLVLMQLYPREYGALLRKKVNESDMGRIESRLMGVDSTEVSAWLFGHWGLNPLLADAVGSLNAPVDRIAGEMNHVQILFLARVLAGNKAVETLSQLEPDLPVPANRLVELGQEAESEVRDMAKTLGIQTRDPKKKSREEAQLVWEIKDFSLFYGTLEQLFSARTQEELMEVLERGLKIIFHVPRLFFFFPDAKGAMLNGTAPRRDKSLKIIESIALPLDSTSSLLAKSLRKKTRLCSLDVAEKTDLAISDTQIVRLLETPGFYTLPLIHSDSPSGILVLGCDGELKRQLDKTQGLLSLFARQAAACMETLRFNQEYARNLNEKKMEAYATMTDKVIHEINNPLSILKSYMESLSLKLPDKHPAQDELSVVKEEMQRISLLLEGLSRYSRPRIGGFDMVEVNPLATRILEILKKSILLPRKIQTRLELDPDLPQVRTDPNGLKQVLINLVKNGAEALEEGGEIRISTRYIAESARILIDEKQKLPGWIEICITDTGPGIPQEIMDHLFEPYNSSKAPGQNKGLGLAIVHSIVKELNGRIQCQSQPGEGARFVVTLPVNGE